MAFMMALRLLHFFKTKICRIYDGVYRNLLSSHSTDDFFVRSGVPLDSQLANDRAIRGFVEVLIVNPDKIVTKWLSIGWTLAFVYAILALLINLVLKPFALLALQLMNTVVLPIATSCLAAFVGFFAVLVILFIILIALHKLYHFFKRVGLYYSISTAVALIAIAIAKIQEPDILNQDFSNHTIINGLKNCSDFGNFEWTATLIGEDSQCSGVLVDRKYVMTAGKWNKSLTESG